MSASTVVMITWLPAATGGSDEPSPFSI